ncbi:MAG: hypothetical protein WAV38_00035 [Xanthobacteraceae bacterium]
MEKKAPPVRDQAEIHWVSVEQLMRSPAFAAGVNDVRRGLPPNYDQEIDDDTWGYERGRLWAMLAPTSMPVMVNGKLNPKAVALCRRAFERKYLI